MTSLLVESLTVSFLVSFLATPIIIFIFRKKGWLEYPEVRKKKYSNVTHSKAVPRGGGIPVFVSIVVTCLVLLPFDFHLKVILVAALINLIIGVLDDISDINPYYRLIANLATALIVVISGISIKVITNPFGGIIPLDKPFLFISLSQIITIVWIVWCTNIVGWSGGVEGQLPGFVTVAGLITGILSLRFGQDITQWPVIILAGAISGAYLGFLPYNFFPQKIMPGYSGKSLAGFILAVLAILSGAKLATVILVLGIPMADGFFSILRRLSKRKIPVWGDSEHLHHLLLKAGVSKPAIAIAYWCFSIIIGVIVLNLNSKQKIYAGVLVLTLVAILILSLKRLIKNKNHSNFSA